MPVNPLLEEPPRRGFSLPLFADLAARWTDWQKGIPPTREFRGRGAQNPRLLLVFAALDRARHRAEEYRRLPTSSP